MAACNTTTGKVLEEMIEPVLRRAGYHYVAQYPVGQRPDGKPYRADLVILEPRRIVISLKWQQVGGTAEEKVPFELMTLAYLVHQGKCEKAYLVLGGTGWSPRLREFYLRGGVRQFFVLPSEVELVSLEDFVAQVNKGGL